MSSSTIKPGSAASSDEAHIPPFKVTAFLTGEAAEAIRAIDARTDLGANEIVGSALILFERMTRPNSKADEMLESAVEAIRKTVEGAR